MKSRKRPAVGTRCGSALEETKVDQPFTENDLRAKCASDVVTLEHVRASPAQAHVKFAGHVDRRKPERMKPLS